MNKNKSQNENKNKNKTHKTNDNNNTNQPTARTVSQLRGRADDRAEAPAGGLCRTPVVARSADYCCTRNPKPQEKP